MNRALSILVSIFVICVIIGAGYYFYSQRTSSPNTSPDNSNVQNSGVKENVSVPVQMNNSQAVKAAFDAAVGGGEDRVVAEKIVLAGSYVLVRWVGNITGGETLLNYDSAGGRWQAKDTIGGTYSVAGLHALGVPQRTVLSLLHDIGQ